MLITRIIKGVFREHIIKSGEDGMRHMARLPAPPTLGMFVHDFVVYLFGAIMSCVSMRYFQFPYAADVTLLWYLQVCFWVPVWASLHTVIVIYCYRAWLAQLPDDCDQIKHAQAHTEVQTTPDTASCC